MKFFALIAAVSAIRVSTESTAEAEFPGRSGKAFNWYDMCVGRALHADLTRDDVFGTDKYEGRTVAKCNMHFNKKMAKKGKKYNE